MTRLRGRGQLALIQLVLKSALQQHWILTVSLCYSSMEQADVSIKANEEGLCVSVCVCVCVCVREREGNSGVLESCVCLCAWCPLSPDVQITSQLISDRPSSCQAANKIINICLRVCSSCVVVLSVRACQHTNLFAVCKRERVCVCK